MLRLVAGRPGFFLADLSASRNRHEGARTAWPLSGHPRFSSSCQESRLRIRTKHSAARTTLKKAKIADSSSWKDQ